MLRKATLDHPGDAAAHRALASVLWLNMLFQPRRGHRRSLSGFVQPDAGRTEQAPGRPRRRVPPARGPRHRARRGPRSTAPRDAQAHYDLGAAVGLQASHIATVEGKMFAGFKAARRAYDEHEKVLELDGSRKDAGLVVGTYRYVVSTLSLPLRMMAYVVGFGGGRERGIAALAADRRVRRGSTHRCAVRARADLQSRTSIRRRASCPQSAAAAVSQKSPGGARGRRNRPPCRSARTRRRAC